MGALQQNASVCTSHAGACVSTERAIGETPDLFADLASSNDRSLAVPARLTSATISATTSAAGTLPTLDAQVHEEKASATMLPRPRRKKPAQIDHLAAARKLQWELRRTRSHSPEEVKTGRLICRHLLALLNEAAQNDALDQKSA